MTERQPLQVPQDFALCKDGTIWRWVRAYTDNLNLHFIPAHWERVPNIPSDEEYEKQKEERQVIWTQIDNKRKRFERRNQNDQNWTKTQRT